MAVISDIGGTSQNSFSINGKTTLFQGDNVPNPLMGNNGDIYFKSEGLMYIKRNNVWEEWTKDSVPDARSYQNKLLYSNGENYDFTKITYNNNPSDPYQLELFQTPNGSSSTTSMIVPNLGLLNDPSKDTNILHKSGKEDITGTKIASGTESFGTSENNNYHALSIKDNRFTADVHPTNRGGQALTFIDKNDKTEGYFEFYHASVSNNNELDRYIAMDLCENGSSKNHIALGFDKQGNVRTKCPHPNANPNDDEIATVLFVLEKIQNRIFPVNSLYLTIDNRNPNEILGFGTWQKVSNGRVLQGSDSSHPAGSTIDPGLPNITGTMENIESFTDNVAPETSGSFTATRTGSGSTSSQGHTSRNTISFNASRSNSIYGNSSTVQPPAYAVNIWRRIV